MKRSCIVCDNSEAMPWTLISGPETFVVPLCPEHEAPLRELGEKAAARASEENPQIVHPKRPPLKPLDWTPPN